MIKSLYVEQFRAMKNMHIPLGKKVTVIAGQNATCKSTLLGMIGQPFGMKDEKTIFDKPFSTKFSDIFKFSKKYDIPGEHVYQVNFYGSALFDKEIEFIKSYKRAAGDTSHIRLVVGKTRSRGEGNLDYPVIYLGLKRTYPIGELQEISETKPTLTNEEIELFNKWYKKVFFPHENISPIQISSRMQKDTLAVNSLNYDYFANSAGQDNIGQILGAILSFIRLKSKLAGDYKGGIILIDELDVTLFPAAQRNLINLFYKLAEKLNLQFVFTTHSIDALEHIIDTRKHNENDTKVLYFTNIYGKLDLLEDPTMERIRADLNISPITDKVYEKINVYCEDREAMWFIKRLLGNKKTKHIKIINATFGGSFLSELAKKNIPEFNNSVIVLDGDMKNMKLKNNVLLLPGEASPENVFREILQGLPAEHEFWQGEMLYTKQVFEKELDEHTGGIYNDRTTMKSWFISQQKAKYWGRASQRLYNCWKNLNPTLVETFNRSFVDVYNMIAKRKSIPLMEE